MGRIVHLRLVSGFTVTKGIAFSENLNLVSCLANFKSLGFWKASDIPNAPPFCSGSDSRRLAIEFRNWSIWLLILSCSLVKSSCGCISDDACSKTTSCSGCRTSLSMTWVLFLTPPCGSCSCSGSDPTLMCCFRSILTVSGVFCWFCALCRRSGFLLTRLSPLEVRNCALPWGDLHSSSLASSLPLGVVAFSL